MTQAICHICEGIFFPDSDRNSVKHSSEYGSGRVDRHVYVCNDCIKNHQKAQE